MMTHARTSGLVRTPCIQAAFCEFVSIGNGLSELSTMLQDVFGHETQSQNVAIAIVFLQYSQSFVIMTKLKMALEVFVPES